VVETPEGPRLGRGADPAKDQSYVLHVLAPDVLSRLILPLGEMTKADVRRIAADLDLRTAHKPESQDVCFITNEHGRESFLGDRIPLRPGRVVDQSTEPKYVIGVDAQTATVTVGEKADMVVSSLTLDSWAWTGAPVTTEVMLQCSAHGTAELGVITDNAVEWTAPHRRIASGQSVVAYVDDLVVGGGLAG
jgi:tRNA-specific 2-thiouridylase